MHEIVQILELALRKGCSSGRNRARDVVLSLVLSNCSWEDRELRAVYR